ncbi:hypothetical protein D9619_003438 [Psilocybe cf. subviscida]|uniref:Holocytochrome c-type synthase n=1 Tax=Psilocybe cf. subviscida TaxID=2480587 RepID=A0A8H5EUE4_9AGAR|nr:hypothetical protein D9619_003438 [Psilocybe cf. subviscida]
MASPTFDSSALPQCPMRKASGPAQCPINPKNNMPDLPQTRVPNQSKYLPTDRTVSTIPRALDATYNGKPADTSANNDGEAAKWEYPSPQQFYNALMRKGWNTPEEHVEAMVLIHNRLNEDAWAELLKWETRFGGGSAEASKVELAEFAGVHGHISHKAWLYQLARKWFPTKFSYTPPFDRHDWIIRRPQTGKRLRYVIDYYSSRKTLLHEPDFLLDVRPASDSVEGMWMKLQFPLERFVTQALSSGRAKASPLTSFSYRQYMMWALLPFILILAFPVVSNFNF